jgi:uncharacterized membrane protein YvbJ
MATRPIDCNGCGETLEDGYPCEECGADPTFQSDSPEETRRILTEELGLIPPGEDDDVEDDL